MRSPLPSLKLAWSFAKQTVFAPIGAWIDQHRKSVLFAVSFAALFLLVSSLPTNACGEIRSASSILPVLACFIFDLIAKILAFIVSTLGSIFVLLVDIFLHFTRYNSFGTAQPVQIGWPIVRDICNMFFIVVLLVSAFATIIGYPDDFNYRKVLPKLLLMAVLINFSKTLILLMIDFSQVIMLSFANAIRQAGAGNFVQAMGITDMMRFANNNPTASAGNGTAPAAGVATATDSISQQLLNYFNIWAALLLAIILLIIAIGTMVIMIMYIIARVILLWISLIFSPIAFLATALPSSLAKKLDVFTGKYWSRLSGVLTGGPIVMFFVWLTLAIVQGSGGQASQSLNLVLPTPEGNGALAFISQIGNTQAIASFIVAIAMLLLGLDAAVSAAASVSDTVGKYAKSIQGVTTRVASTTARLGAGALVAAGSAGAVPLAATGLSRLNRRYDITGRAAKYANVVPGANTLLKEYSAAVTGGKGTSFQDIMMANKRREKEEQENKLKEYNALPEHAKGLARWQNKPIFNPLATKAQMGAYADMVSDYTSEANRKNRVMDMMNTERAGFEKAAGRPMTKQEETDMERRVNEQVNMEAVDMMKKAQGIYQETGTRTGARDTAFQKKAEDTEKAIDEMLKKNPGLITDPAKEKEIYDNLKKNKKDAEESNVHENLSTLLKMLPDSAVKKNSAGDIIGFEEAAYDRFMATHKSSKQGEAMAAVKKYLDGTEGGIKADSINNLGINKDEKGTTRMYDRLTGTDAAKSGEGIVWYKSDKEAAASNMLSSGSAEFATTGMNAEGARGFIAAATEVGLKDATKNASFAEANKDNKIIENMGAEIAEYLEQGLAKIEAGDRDGGSKQIQMVFKVIEQGGELDADAQEKLVSSMKSETVVNLVKQLPSLVGKQKASATKVLEMVSTVEERMSSQKSKGAIPKDSNREAALKTLRSGMDAARKYIDGLDEKQANNYSNSLKSVVRRESKED